MIRERHSKKNPERKSTGDFHNIANGGRGIRAMGKSFLNPGVA